MCYAVSLLGAAATTVAWNRTKSVKIWWLSLLFYGGALFGVVDHLWNGELFLITENLVSDLLLGAVIALSMVVVWGVMLLLVKFSPTLANYVDIKN